MIILNNNNYNNNKQNTYNRQNSYRGREKTILIYYIPTTRILPCLICSASITFFQTKTDKCL